MIGEIVTLYDRLATGTYGYVIIVDLTYLYARSLDTFTVINSASESISSENTLQELLAYLEDSNCPNIAYSKSSEIAYLFFKTSLYPFTDDTKFILFGKRNAIPIDSLNDNVDVKDEHFELFVNYIVQEAAQLLNKQIPQLTIDNIKLLESMIGN